MIEATPLPQLVDPLTIVHSKEEMREPSSPIQAQTREKEKEIILSLEVSKHLSTQLIEEANEVILELGKTTPRVTLDKGKQKLESEPKKLDMMSWLFNKNDKTCKGMITIIELLNTLRYMVSKVENQALAVSRERSKN